MTFKYINTTTEEMEFDLGEIPDDLFFNLIPEVIKHSIIGMGGNGKIYITTLNADENSSTVETSTSLLDEVKKLIEYSSEEDEKQKIENLKNLLTTLDTARNEILKALET